MSILLGIDGLGKFYNNENAPNLMKFIKNGVSVDVNAVYPTDSAENWGSILTGVIPSMHKLKLETLGKCYKNTECPSLFKIIAEKFGESNVAAFVSWKPILTGMIENTVKMTKYSPTIDENIFAKFWMYTSHYYLKNSIYDSFTLPKVVKFIRENKKLKFLFIQLVDLDEVGHIYGFGSDKYNAKIKEIDNYVGEIIDAINCSINDPLIVITTDHGGKGTKHGGNSIQEKEVFIATNIELKSNSYFSNRCCAKIILNYLKIKVPENFNKL